MPSVLAAKIKAKYPQYADIEDSVLEAQVLAKHPEYEDLAKTPNLPTDEAIQANVAESPSQQSGMLETALGVGLTGGMGLGNPLAQGLGRGAMDASARMVNNVGAMLGSSTSEGEHTPERAAELNAQLNPRSPAESLGQLLPTVATTAVGVQLGQDSE